MITPTDLNKLTPRAMYRLRLVKNKIFALAFFVSSEIAMSIFRYALIFIVVRALIVNLPPLVVFVQVIAGIVVCAPIVLAGTLFIGWHESYTFVMSARPTNRVLCISDRSRPMMMYSASRWVDMNFEKYLNIVGFFQMLEPTFIFMKLFRRKKSIRPVSIGRSFFIQIKNSQSELMKISRT